MMVCKVLLLYSVSCYAGLSCSSIVLYRHTFVPTKPQGPLKLTVSYQRQSAITFTCVHNRHNPHRYLITPQTIQSVSQFITHAAQTLFRSHNAPISKYFSQHKSSIPFTCIRHRHIPRIYSVTT